MTELKFPQKWRETVDPFGLPYTRFSLTEVLGYPHAGNDVFYARGVVDGKEEKVFIKVNRQAGADVRNEVEVLARLNHDNLPKIVDYDKEMTFRVSVALEGERLSSILGDNEGLQSMAYMQEYGRTLAELHLSKGEFASVKDRRFFHVPTKEQFEKLGIDLSVREFLLTNVPERVNECFCHGDFHYANVLWKDGKLSGILDFELSGWGNREFDIAWAIIRRPGQSFLTEEVEIDAFLRGYRTLNECNERYVRYYMVQIYCWFTANGDEEYCEFVKKKIARYMGEYKQQKALA